MASRRPAQLYGRVKLDGELVELPAYSNAKRLVARADALRQFQGVG